MVLHRAIQAARAGELSTLKELASCGHLSTAIVDAQGAGPVHHAARCGQFECLQYLVNEFGLQGDARALNLATPGHDAAATGHARELQWLIEQGGCHIEDRDAAGASALHLSARFGCVDVTQWLLSAGAEAEAESHCGALPAHYAAANGDLTCLKLLIQQAPRTVNCQTGLGATPLYLACQEGHQPIVQFLVEECGADVNLRAYDGMSCMHAAAHLGHRDIVLWLVTCTDVDLCAQDREGATALHFAASRGHYCILERLLHVGSKVMKDYWGGTPLHDAAENGELECCKLLLTHRADPTEKDVDGFTAADLAEYNGHSECARYLRFTESKASCTDKPVEVTTPSEEEVKSKPVSVQQSRADYYGSLGNTCGNNNTNNKPMDSLKQPESEDSPQARYPQSSAGSADSGSVVLEKTFSNKIEQVQFSTAVIKGFNLPKSDGSEKTVPDKRPDACLLGGNKLLGKSITSLKQSGLSGAFTGQANKMVVLPTEEANLSDIDYLVPTHDERGRPIAEWKRQVMVRQLQARLLDEEDQRRKENGNKFAKVTWRFSQAHNAILGPSGELLTEDDLIYLEQQIANVSMQRNCAGYELELARLAEELRHILPAPIVNITVNTQFRNFPSQIPLPVWCGRISGIVQSMSLLMTNLTDQPYCKMPNTELTTVFSQTSDRQNSTRGRRESRERVEGEIQQFGVSVRNLKSNFETQTKIEEVITEKTEQQEKQPIIGTSCSLLQASQFRILPKALSACPEMDQNSDSGIDQDDNLSDVQETNSLRKERIVVLFLGHWKKSAYTVAEKNKDTEERKNDAGNLTIDDKTALSRSGSMENTKIMNSSLGHFFQQRRAVNKMLGSWRNMISSVPSRQIRRLHKQQALYSPEQFLPRVDGVPVEYDKLTLDLFMLGYFHILELELPVDERKMRHLLCFEVFDHVGSFPWETVRDFHKAVIQEIEAGNREWKDGFEDIKVKFFGNAVSPSENNTEVVKHTLPEVRQVPKVIVQTPTPDESILYKGTDISSFSNEEICKYIDRSFAFWKEREAEIFDFE
ncbi:espin-like protein [Periophthalmus magnuspinnatus]|uniref:espin-like protein n=1 Tax=Periophthalmus magnuspinnatus TaxID=409849 RepID=UPI00145AD289|nr:espin-like protein [Periophthalmus magnuspinnatus]